MEPETGRKRGRTGEFLKDLDILLGFTSALVVGGAEWHAMTSDREMIPWGLSGTWGLNPDNSSTLSSLFPLSFKMPSSKILCTINARKHSPREVHKIRMDRAE